MSSIGNAFPFSIALKSSMAIFAARAEPAPPRSEYKPDMSVNTPILTTPSDNFGPPAVPFAGCANTAATGAADSAIPIKAEMSLRFMMFTTSFANLYAQQYVQSLHLVIELGRCNSFDHAAMLDDIVSIRQWRCESEILFDDDYGITPFFKRPDNTPQHLYDNRCESFADLIQQQQFCAGAQDARDRKHLLFTAGQTHTGTCAPFLQVRKQCVYFVNGHAAAGDERRQQQ